MAKDIALLTQRAEKQRRKLDQAEAELAMPRLWRTTTRRCPSKRTRLASTSVRSSRRRRPSGPPSVAARRRMRPLRSSEAATGERSGTATELEAHEAQHAKRRREGWRRPRPRWRRLGPASRSRPRRRPPPRRRPRGRPRPGRPPPRRRPRGRPRPGRPPPRRRPRGRPRPGRPPPRRRPRGRPRPGRPPPRRRPRGRPRPGRRLPRRRRPPRRAPAKSTTTTPGPSTYRGLRTSTTRAYGGGHGPTPDRNPLGQRHRAGRDAHVGARRQRRGQGGAHDPRGPRRGCHPHRHRRRLLHRRGQLRAQRAADRAGRCGNTTPTPPRCWSRPRVGTPGEGRAGTSTGDPTTSARPAWLRSGASGSSGSISTSTTGRIPRCRTTRPWAG